MAMEKNILYNGRKIFYEEYGNGYPVMLLHGFAEDRTIWKEQINHLKNNYQLIIPDIPGSGKSEVTDYNASIDDHANWIKAILDTVKIKQCILIGHSMGGYIALAFATKYADYLKGLGLFHSTTYPDSEEKKETRRKSIAFIRQYGAAPFIEQSTPNLFSEKSKKENAQIITDSINRYSNFDPLSLISYYEAMIQRPDRTHVLSSFTNPVMFIMGEEDKAVPIQHSLEQCHIPQSSFIHIAENTAHMGMIEDRVPSNVFIENYLNHASKI
ncbi:MAG: alpha/beta hydrolase [Bacteroidetes bacterium]|nr:alpha/beta hydrolase [Bacteroidota bacterium]